jgi:alkanesulfonate monooxygenase SsuD/methylene tetrahydromethanopterin reductase-like flavin-dependent oxidoreductase (luciferase family)
VSPESFAERGRLGEGIITSPNFTPLSLMKKNFDLYRDAMVENGHDLASCDLPFMQQVWVGDTRDGMRNAAEAALNYYRSVKKVIPGSKEALEAEQSYYDKVARNIDLLTVEQTLTHGGNFGNADRVAATINDLREHLGINHYIGWLRIPSLDRKEALRSMQQFAAEVIPQLRTDAPAPALQPHLEASGA